MDARETQIYSAIIAAVTVLGTVVIYFIYNVIRQHKKVLTLERDSAKAQVALLEKDRARIAADLHDDLAPMLVSVKMKINSFDLASTVDSKRLGSANDTIDDIARRMRSISFDLMPSTLEQKGLLTAFREFISSVGGDRLRIRFIPPEQEPALSAEQTIHTYRVLQEIVHNTIKHATATELVVSMHEERRRLVVTTVDNGCGFDVEETLGKNKGLGLKSIRNRVHLLRAHYKIISHRGGGTQITIQIPVLHE